MPSEIAFHSSVVYKGAMYLFGGCSNLDENNKFYKLDLKTFEWELLDVFDQDSEI